MGTCVMKKADEVCEVRTASAKRPSAAAVFVVVGRERTMMTMITGDDENDDDSLRHLLPP